MKPRLQSVKLASVHPAPIEKTYTSLDPTPSLNQVGQISKLSKKGQQKLECIEKEAVIRPKVFGNGPEADSFDLESENISIKNSD